MTGAANGPARGALSNTSGRHERWRREAIDDGWDEDAQDPPPALRTTLGIDSSRRVISFNDSPDVPFDRSVNPYRGCEHGCIYCFARPSHAWLGLSPGLDFESRLFYKPAAAARLRDELRQRGYRPAPITLGANTDPYQPIERRLGITRAILEVLDDCHHPVQIVTKSWLIERDRERLAAMAGRGLVQVAVSVTTLDTRLARAMEPRAAAPRRRIETIARLRGAGIPVTALVAPVIPGLNDAEIERLLEAARGADALDASHILLRLPGEVATLFQEWLHVHYPERAARVLGLLRDARDGRLSDHRFGQRMRGSGPVAQLIAERMRIGRRRLGFPGTAALECGAFRPPAGDGPAQMALL